MEGYSINAILAQFFFSSSVQFFFSSLNFFIHVVENFGGPVGLYGGQPASANRLAGFVRNLDEKNSSWLA